MLRRPDNIGEEEETRFILLAGEPLNQPIYQHGPFVLNTQAQAREAIMDYQLGRNGFEKAPGWQSTNGKAFR
jgi:redox-sensitive bicupin YhaK (pirin superfamily)